MQFASGVGLKVECLFACLRANVSLNAHLERSELTDELAGAYTADGYQRADPCARQSSQSDDADVRATGLCRLCQALPRKDTKD